MHRYLKTFLTLLFSHNRSGTEEEYGVKETLLQEVSDLMTAAQLNAKEEKDKKTKAREKVSPQKNGTLLDLPLEIIMQICRYLPLQASLQLSACNHYLHDVIMNTQSVWQKIEVHHCPEINSDVFQKVILPHVPQMIHLVMGYSVVHMDASLVKDFTSALSNNTELQWLDLTGFVDLGNEMIRCLNSPELKTLCAGECNINEISGLENCISLEWLDLSFNPISAAHILQCIANIPNLQTLQLAGIEFSIHELNSLMASNNTLLSVTVNLSENTTKDQCRSLVQAHPTVTFSSHNSSLFYLVN